MPTGPAPGMPDLNDPSLYGGTQDEQGNWQGMTNAVVPPIDGSTQVPSLAEPTAPIIPAPSSTDRNATAQFTEAEWAEIRAGLDQNFGDESVGTVEGQQTVVEPGSGTGTAPTTAPTVPDPYADEVDLAGVRVPKSDQEALASIYTALRNRPEIAPELIGLVQKTNQAPAIPAAPAPDGGYAWQSPVQPTVGTPAPVIPNQPPPGQVQIQLPPGADMDDPMVQWQVQQMQQIQANQAAMMQALQASQQQKQQVSTAETRRQNVEAGVRRFAASHPELNNDQIGHLANRLGNEGLMIALVQKLPEDQAAARGLELMLAADRPSLATGNGTNNPVHDARSRTLTSLAGGSSSGAVSREPAPVAPPSSDREARQQAAEWLAKSGVDLTS